MHSTETMNVMMTDQMLQAMDDKKLTIVVQLDFSKAFDSIDHNKLLSKLKTQISWYLKFCIRLVS